MGDKFIDNEAFVVKGASVEESLFKRALLSDRLGGCGNRHQTGYPYK